MWTMCLIKGLFASMANVERLGHAEASGGLLSGSSVSLAVIVLCSSLLSLIVGDRGGSERAINMLFALSFVVVVAAAACSSFFDHASSTKRSATRFHEGRFGQK